MTASINRIEVQGAPEWMCWSGLLVSCVQVVRPTYHSPGARSGVCSNAGDWGYSAWDGTWQPIIIPTMTPVLFKYNYNCNIVLAF